MIPSLLHTQLCHEVQLCSMLLAAGGDWQQMWGAASVATAGLPCLDCSNRGMLGLQAGGFTACAGVFSVPKSNLSTPDTLTKPSSCFFREYLCVDKTGTLTTDHVTLLKHLNPQLRSSDTLLDLAYINSSMQASYTSLAKHSLGMAALLEACPRLELLHMCPADPSGSMTRYAQSMQQLTGPPGCCCYCTACLPAAIFLWQPAPACLHVK